MSDNKILLSILIPTVVGREKEYDKLFGKLRMLGKCIIGDLTQKNIHRCEGRDGVELISLKDNKEMTIGEKREKLYQMATGTHSWMIDDDDDIALNAIQLILEEIKNNPTISCITFRERCIMNGNYHSSNHSIIYKKWQDDFDGYNFVRCPFYKDIIRTDIAKSVPFPKIRYNEDEQWSMAIKPLLTDEIHIDEELYYYNYEPKDSHSERYGIKD